MGYMVNYLLEKFSILRLDCAKEIKIIFIMEEIENMKDFFKWLGVNEKVAKIVIWMLIFMTTLIIVNTCLDSVGFPYYKVTVENISKIDIAKIINIIFSWIINILNFYSITLLVFRIKNFKKLFKYAVVYLVLAILTNSLLNYGFSQLFMFIYILVFCFLYSERKWKYCLYGFGAIVINILVQYICYLYKIRFIDYSTISQATRIILSLDYFIIMGIIILVKEIYLKKRSDKEWTGKHQACYGSENSKKKEILQRN